MYGPIDSGNEIERAKAALHEAYCLKHLYKCHCGEVLEKTQRDEHDKENHRPINCQYCRQSFMKPQLNTHLSKCESKPKLCEFCECEISADCFLQHRLICGSKTELCEKCRKYIPKRDWLQHQLTPCQSAPVPTPLPVSVPNLRPMKARDVLSFVQPNPKRFKSSVPVPSALARNTPEPLPFVADPQLGLSRDFQRPHKPEVPRVKPKPEHKEPKVPTKASEERSGLTPDRDLAEKMQMQEYQDSSLPHANVNEIDKEMAAPSDYTTEQLIPDRMEEERAPRHSHDSPRHYSTLEDEILKKVIEASLQSQPTVGGYWSFVRGSLKSGLT